MKLLEASKRYFERHEQIISPATLIGGFIFDYFTLQRVDFLFDNLFIIFYLILAGGSIVLINLYEEGKFREGFIENIYEFLPFIVQFAFGGLFSAFIIFYSKSASFFTSGVFILILLILFIGNEFFKTKYSKLVFQVAIYFSAIFSFSIYFLPVLTRKMGVIVFILSGIISLVVIGLFALLLSRVVPTRFIESKKPLIASVLVIYAFMNILYFTNIIPPIPLSMRTGDVYHFIERQSDGNYIAIGEKDTWKEKLDLAQKVHLEQGEPVYFWSAVFAPTDLNTPIVHDWQYFDEGEGEWISVTKITFPIRGGRDEGYRGFSKKENIFPGEWRVDVKTERGQVIGRVRFDVESGEAELIEETI